MVKIEEFEEEFVELFGFILSQEIAKESPVDTGKLRNSFPATLEVNGTKILWEVPYYWEFLEYGTINMRANPFVRRTIENKKDDIAKKVIKIISNR